MCRRRLACELVGEFRPVNPHWTNYPRRFYRLRSP